VGGPAIERDIDLGYDGLESGVFVSGEHRLMAELLGNLVDNAIQYGGAWQDQRWHHGEPPMLFVEDEGRAFRRRARTRVEPFYRTRDSVAGAAASVSPSRVRLPRVTVRCSGSSISPRRGARVEVVFPITPNASNGSRAVRRGPSGGAGRITDVARSRRFATSVVPRASSR
jgi:two-component system sensor histidine kinase TctE